MKRARQGPTYLRRCAESASQPIRPELLAEVVRRNRALESDVLDARSERDELRRAMYEGAQMQRRLCGPRWLKSGSFEFATEIFPARHLSGDFTVMLEFGDEVAFAIGDIAGKGLPAAMWFTHMVNMTRDSMLTYKKPAVIMQALNQKMCEATLDAPLTTMFLGTVNVLTGKLRWSNAGHPAPHVMRADGSCQYLEDGGPVLGAVPEARFSGGETLLHAGESVLAYSDGVLECRDAAGAEFGVEGLLRSAKQSISPSASVMLFSVLAAAQEFTVNANREDDMAMLVISRAR